jgi:NADH-quinone oxidoreductase subunit L
MLALGGGGYVAGVFHLTTHAFFKALLFLGAGSVIIAMHHNEDMWAMGGLKEKMPVTYYAFLSGSLALAGIVPFSGFWSKDEVLYETLVHGLGGSPLLLAAYAMGLLAVFFTGFYTFRMVLLTFHGEPRSDLARDPHGVRWNVKAPLVILGTLAAVVGVINLVPVHTVVPAVPEFLHDWLYGGPADLNGKFYTDTLLADYAGYSSGTLPGLGEVATLFASAGLSLTVALAGSAVAVALYRGPSPEEHTDKLGSLKTVLFNNYYQDEYQVWLARGLTVRVARAADAFDVQVVDGVVNFVSSLSLFTGDRLRRLQTGIVSNYAALLTLGLTLLLVAFGVMQGWFL